MQSPTTTRVHDSLDAALARKRVVIWYDAPGEWSDVFVSYTGKGVEKRRVEGNEFASKVLVARGPSHQRFLLYIPSEKPEEKDNWLLDLLLAGHEFKADRASLDIQDAGLTLEFRDLAKQHSAFFRSMVRTQKLREQLRSTDDARSIRLKMMAVLAGVPADIDKLLLHFLSRAEPHELPLSDEVQEAYGSHALVEAFWAAVVAKFGYGSTQPNLRDFAVSLFRSVNPLQAKADLKPHGRVFLSFWKDSLSSRPAFEAWSTLLADTLQIEAQLADATDPQLGDDDTFELFDRYTLHRLVQGFQAGAPACTLLELIRSRRSSTWFEKHRRGYQAIEQAIQLRSLLQTTELSVASFDQGLQLYVERWWQLDQAYRLCIANLRAYGQPGLMEGLKGWVENHYVNNFLLPLSDHWSDQVAKLTTWQAEALPRQREFYARHVNPVLAKGQRLFVVVSDALRYEAARELAQKLTHGKGWSTEVEALFGALPSYTQLGMAALLPGAQITINPADATVAIDGQSASGTNNRDKILKGATGGRAKAIRAGDFLALNSRTDGRTLTKDHDLIVIYHNVIDQVGDKLNTEASTFEAVEQAFEELQAILRKIANLNGSHVVITADHGFLFQQEAVDTIDTAVFPKADALTFKNRRFAYGEEIDPARGLKVFTAQALGFMGTWSAVFPLSLGRFPIKGSGSRFVHGGPLLQEVVVPVIKLKRERKDDSCLVEVEVLRVPSKVTTGKVPVSLFQRDAISPTVLPIRLKVALYAKADGTLLCESKTLVFDSTAAEPREREQRLELVLSNAAEAYNNQPIELRFERWVAGVNDPVPDPGKTVELKLQRAFGSDFDDF
ncbi:BREX-1 system phosphatase PglZ type A [Synechococcus sp. Tobar12-5m-g]|uniref:BREX-1 system phosphatase PglZ type A n=1 Tax=unclassified Synechococcus TaxID=2626047 RepID=UPI0020CD704E|nr:MULTISPECIES: BREX-1 system phosphatase PglZ type A [unclassified Synechococcus]MCP9771674.1 BREX-1 system phosphatase PglZ type A [Synechococcus sp. Tobar12-5m-g]MCP9872615.1 BREX-1 system phosphatase PglZ type A [Synechococcus sp. Cruz CV-v-12]